MSNDYYPYYSTNPSQNSIHRPSADQHQSSNQLPVSGQYQQTAHTTSNNVSQQSSYSNHQPGQPARGLQWHGDGTIESRTRAAGTLTSLGTANVRNGVRARSPVATQQHGATHYGNQAYSSSSQSAVSSPQLLNNMVIAQSQCGSVNLRSQGQNHSSTSGYGAVNGDGEEEKARPVDRTDRMVIAEDGTITLTYPEWRPGTFTSRKNGVKIKPASRPPKPHHHRAARTHASNSIPSANRSAPSGPNVPETNPPPSSTTPHTRPPPPSATAPTTAPPRSFAQPVSDVEYRAATAADDTSLLHKKGRPVGRRKHPNGGGGSDDGSSSSAAKPPAAAKPIPEPKYPIFPCGWLGCGARLHNLETLRRHVRKFHGRQGEDELWKCRWEGCERAVPSVSAEMREVWGTRRPVGFETLDKLHEHVENVHVSPIAWKLGDGPRGGLFDAHDSEMSEVYLGDDRGRRVTPRISVPASASQAGSNVSAPASRGPGRLGPKTAQEKAKESEEAAIRRKREMGPGVDKGGARLANAKRRKGFRDDEKFEIVVDDDED